MASAGKHACVAGLAWGDEGKGKIVDLLCRDYDIVVRYNGGANAGHTVCVGADKFALHLLPTGVLHADKQAVIGPGMVVDPAGLVEEIDGLEGRGISLEGRLHISDRAHLVMPYHRLEDRLSESSGVEDERIGTTTRGIGPCYADKMRRTTAVRMCDLLDPDRCAGQVRRIVEIKRRMLQALYGTDQNLNAAEVWTWLLTAARRLAPLVTDTTRWLDERVRAGGRILFEGANGLLLDVDHGTYPYVTSSQTGPQGIASGAGVPPDWVGRRIGVTKAYTTRVGGGPFPTELCDATGDRIRAQGHEYGTTTGRPRRCGWLDAAALRYTVHLGGISEIAVMHLDTLSGFEQVAICTAYRGPEGELSTMPADAELLGQVDPVLERLEGWSGDLRSVSRYADLPAATRHYVERIESLCGVPVTIISVGPERDQTIFRS